MKLRTTPLTWDGENRLTNIVAMTTTGPQLYIKFEYDWQGRRIHKQVWTNTNGTGTASIDQKYLYDGWNMIAEKGSVRNFGILALDFEWGGTERWREWHDNCECNMPGRSITS